VDPAAGISSAAAPAAAPAITAEKLAADLTEQWSSALKDEDVMESADYLIQDAPGGWNTLYPPNAEILEQVVETEILCRDDSMASGACNQVFLTENWDQVFKPFPEPTGQLIGLMAQSRIALSPTALASNIMFTHQVSQIICEDIGIPLDDNPFLSPTLCHNQNGEPGIAFPLVEDLRNFSNPPPEALDTAVKRGRFYKELACIGMVGTLTGQVDLHGANVVWGKGADREWHLYVVDYDLINISKCVKECVFGENNRSAGAVSSTVGWPVLFNPVGGNIAEIYDFARNAARVMLPGMLPSGTVPSTELESLLNNPPISDRYLEPHETVDSGEKFEQLLANWGPKAVPSLGAEEYIAKLSEDKKAQMEGSHSRQLAAVKLTEDGEEFARTMGLMFPIPGSTISGSLPPAQYGVDGNRLLRGSLKAFCRSAGFISK
jgi:hypothetical protein